MEHVTFTERLELYQRIRQKLIEPFPPGTLEAKEGSADAKYIPVQAYMHRLEEAAGPFWSWQTVGEPMIHEGQDMVQVNGILTILDAKREGIGLAGFQRYPDTGRIKNFKYVVLAAASEALRDACDKYEMGWVDLAPYRKWAKNPGAGLMMSSTTGKAAQAVSTKTCMVCKEVLSLPEAEQLERNGIKLTYCQRHIPAHLLKKMK